MKTMNSFFSDVQSIDTDLYIVDYTEQTKSTSDKRGVELHTSDPSDIEALHMHNPKEISFQVANLEGGENKIKLAALEGELPSLCEAVCFTNQPEESEKKKWVLLTELKYCKKENAPKNVRKAFKQLESSYSFLVKHHLLSTSENRIYLVISLPKQSNTPFESFAFSPAKLLELKKEKKYMVRGTNDVGIVSCSRLELK